MFPGGTTVPGAAAFPGVAAPVPPVLPVAGVLDGVLVLHPGDLRVTAPGGAWPLVRVPVGSALLVELLLVDDATGQALPGATVRAWVGATTPTTDAGDPCPEVVANTTGTGRYQLRLTPEDCPDEVRTRLRIVAQPGTGQQRTFGCVLLPTELPT